MTPQQAMQAKQVYGSQIMVTTACSESANRWASLLGRFAKVQKIVQGVDYAKENKGTCLLPSTINVWRVWATI